jgi:hypothetical protein
MNHNSSLNPNPPTLASSNIVHLLRNRQYGNRHVPISEYLNPQIQSTLNHLFHNVSTLVQNLKLAMIKKDWNQISTAISTIVSTLLDPNPHQFGDGAGSAGVDPLSLTAQLALKKKEQREMFILLDGMKLLIQFLGPGSGNGNGGSSFTSSSRQTQIINKTDARDLNTSHIQRYAVVWNEILVLLREVCYSIPNLANQIFTNSQVVFLFTMLSHENLFENAINLLEEILAIRLETFCLDQIPNFYSLLNSLSTRRLAHFCRVLALVLFEPEDRMIMENSEILRSYELLLLRRERINKLSALEIEKNQCLIIEMPGLLKKLVTLLKLTNYGPSISDLLQNNFAMPNELTTEFIMHLSPTRNRNEWTYLESLEKTLLLSSHGAATSATSRASASRRPAATEREGATRGGRGQSQSTFLSSDPWLDSFDSMDDFALFSPGEDLDDSSLPSTPPPTTSYLNAVSTNGSNNSRDMEHSLLDLMRVMRTGNHTPQQALNELQFQALALAPHQVELLFVLCTLLSGQMMLSLLLPLPLPPSHSCSSFPLSFSPSLSLPLPLLLLLLLLLTNRTKEG